MPKKAITIIASEDTFKNLSTFNSIDDLNKTIRHYKENFKTKLSKSTLLVLDQLHRYSCKFIGVSFRTKNHIAESLHISRKTVQRACNALEDLGIIKQLEMKRKSDMRQTSNAILINPITEDVQQETKNNEEKCPSKKTTSITLKQKIKDINKRNIMSILQNQNIKNANFVAHWVPKRFVQLSNCFFSDAKVIQEFWKVVRQNNRIVNHETDQRAFTVDQELSIGIRAFKDFVMKIKSGIGINNAFGYFNGVCSNIMDKLYWDKGFMDDCD